MRGRNILGACLAILLVAALLGIGYHLGGGRDRDAREAVRAVVGDRLASLDGIEARLSRLEGTIASLRGGPSTDAGDATGGAEKTAPDAEARLAAIDAGLSRLQQRVEGLEQDPLRRGYSFLASEDPELRREGINALQRVARFDPEARAAIRALLRDPSARVREQAAQVLRDLKDKESAPEMKALLADSDARTRRRAVEALAAMDARDAAREIGRNLVSDPDDRVRETAADVLGRLRSPEAEEYLTEMLKDRNEAVRGEAIAALGEIGATSAAPRLRALYDEDPGSHRMRLALALKGLGDGVPFELEVGRLSHAALEDGDDRVRLEAIRELAILSPEGAQKVFAQALKDPSAAVRREAERALR